MTRRSPRSAGPEARRQRTGAGVMPEVGTTGAAAGPAGAGWESAGAPPGGADTLRDALRGHRAGPELLAVLDDLADRPLPAGWRRWGEEGWDRYLDEVLAEARVRRAAARRRPDAV